MNLYKENKCALIALIFLIEIKRCTCLQLFQLRLASAPRSLVIITQLFVFPFQCRDLLKMRHKVVFKNILAGMFILTLVFAPCAYAGKVDYPTLYPSPNGEYANLYSTIDSYFATTSGNVGIGMASGASVKLDVVQNGVIKVGQAYLSSGGNILNFGNNAWYNSTSSWQFPGATAGVIFQINGASYARFMGHDGVGNFAYWVWVYDTTGWWPACSQAVKQNIHTLTVADYALLREEFRATDLFSYNRKDIPTEPEVGFIAEHAPGLILDKTKTHVPLIKAIGYLAAVLKAQENVLIPLEKEVRVLRNEIQASGDQQRRIDILRKEVEGLKKEFV
jgi:hypothetical protein